jgi:sterol desaturase/sphingolipid hydroxylase (fatty acid hydroxylase superfamily)
MYLIAAYGSNAHFRVTALVHRTYLALELLIASKSHNFHVEDHLMLLATWGTFLVAAAVAFWLEAKAETQELSLKTFWSFCFPAEGWKCHSARTDIFLYIVGKFTAPAAGLAGLLLTGVTSVYVSRYLLLAGLTPRSTKGGVFVAIVLGFIFFLVNDFSNYLTHLAEHKVQFLWEFHKVHHTATFLTPLTTAREHPLVMAFDGIVSGLLLSFVVGAAHAYYGYSEAEMMGMLATANMLGTLLVLDSIRHSQFPVSFGKLDRVLISPHMHQLHHSVKEAHWNKNMGNKLSIWDGMFHTTFIPVRGERLQFGSGSSEEDYEYRSMLRCYWVPIVKNFRALKGPRAGVLDPGIQSDTKDQECMSEVA